MKILLQFDDSITDIREPTKHELKAAQRCVIHEAEEISKATRIDVFSSILQARGTKIPVRVRIIPKLLS